MHSAGLALTHLNTRLRVYEASHYCAQSEFACESDAQAFKKLKFCKNNKKTGDAIAFHRQRLGKNGAPESGVFGGRKVS